MKGWARSMEANPYCRKDKTAVRLRSNLRIVPAMEGIHAEPWCETTSQ